MGVKGRTASSAYAGSFCSYFEGAEECGCLVCAFGRQGAVSSTALLTPLTCFRRVKPGHHIPPRINNEAVAIAFPLLTVLSCLCRGHHPSLTLHSPRSTQKLPMRCPCRQESVADLVIILKSRITYCRSTVRQFFRTAAQTECHTINSTCCLGERRRNCNYTRSEVPGQSLPHLCVLTSEMVD